VTIDLAPGLPQLLADTGTLAQAVANVLTNALEAGSTVRASTAMKTDFIAEAGATYAPGRPPQGRYVVIEIADDGPGIAAEVAGRLFEPFASTRAAGRGLGLPATAGIMGAHHGFVEIRASPAGCTVRLLLPAP
jgi:nitrogen-specific signal transduction histidine kinase